MVQNTQFAEIDMREMILLDSNSNITIMCNKKHVRNVQHTNDCIDVEINGGIAVSNMKCCAHDIGEHWFCENSITNILLLSNIADKHRVHWNQMQKSR